MYRYMKIDTGEVFTKEGMLKDFAENYDGLDPTNGISLWEYYIDLEGKEA